LGIVATQLHKHLKNFSIRLMQSLLKPFHR
jgi:hypothetical protein